MANVQDIVFILMQGFSGAVAGYITNNYYDSDLIEKTCLKLLEEKILILEK